MEPRSGRLTNKMPHTTPDLRDDAPDDWMEQALVHDAREHRDAYVDDAAPPDEPGGGDHARAATLKIDMERALATLSDAERAAIVQCYHNDLSHEEAAYVLGCPVGTVKTHVLRGKQKLKRVLAAWNPGPAA